MKLFLQAEPGEAARKAGELLRAIAEDFAPASAEARAVLEALEENDVDAAAARPMRSKRLEKLRTRLQRIAAAEIEKLEPELTALDRFKLQKALTESKRVRLRELVKRAWSRIIARAFGVGALTPEERSEVGRVQSVDAVDGAYESGVRAVDRDSEAGVEEQLAHDAALERAGELVRGLADRNAERYERVFDADDVKSEVANAVAQRMSPKVLAANLKSASKDTLRDWDRAATSELQDAHNRGRAAAIKLRHGGGDPDVYKQPAPSACTWCLALHLGPDGAPRIFKLSTLEAHGNNAGRKKSQWQAVIGPVHPHCFCEIGYLAPGWGFDEDGDAVPDGEFGVRYETEDELEKALFAEREIQKAALLGGDVEIQGLKIRIEANAGDVRKWRGGQTVLRHAYGEILETCGADGEPVDVYLGPDPTAQCAYAVLQLDPKTGQFDEQKLMLCFGTPHAAEAAYLLHYPPEFYGGMQQLTMDELRDKLAHPDPDGVIKGDAEERLYAVGRDERGWKPTGDATDRGTKPKKRTAQKPADPDFSLVAHEKARIAYANARKRIVPPAVVVVRDRSSMRSAQQVYDIPDRVPLATPEELTAEVERRSAQLETRTRMLREHARPDPNLGIDGTRSDPAVAVVLVDANLPRSG